MVPARQAWPRRDEGGASQSRRRRREEGGSGPRSGKQRIAYPRLAVNKRFVQAIPHHRWRLTITRVEADDVVFEYDGEVQKPYQMSKADANQLWETDESEPEDDDGPTSDSDVWDDWTFGCRCNNKDLHEGREWIQCETCKRWSHLGCCTYAASVLKELTVTLNDRGEARTPKQVKELWNTWVETHEWKCHTCMLSDAPAAGSSSTVADPEEEVIEVIEAEEVKVEEDDPLQPPPQLLQAPAPQLVLPQPQPLQVPQPLLQVPQQLLQAPVAAPQPPQPLQLQPDVKDFLGQAIEEAVEAPDVVDHDAIRAACAAAIALLPVIA